MVLLAWCMPRSGLCRSAAAWCLVSSEVRLSGPQPAPNDDERSPGLENTSVASTGRARGRDDAISILKQNIDNAAAAPVPHASSHDSQNIFLCTGQEVENGSWLSRRNQSFARVMMAVSCWLSRRNQNLGTGMVAVSCWLSRRNQNLGTGMVAVSCWLGRWNQNLGTGMVAVSCWLSRRNQNLGTGMVANSCWLG
ncbi:hypothetical protein RRG08_000517 [Elysia crispata]|uniref:Secreted protein n=1 Tax=Elysia crispata TaxID=231223 RepID=A0AAE1CWA5_9GAST|nr:hypothetical protein RRG08_000517 [Elysia crispata]